MSALKGCYRPRRVRSTVLWRIMDRWWQRFLSDYDEVLESRYGYLRKEVKRAGEKYLKCGILDFGFARVRCGACGEELMVAFSCRVRICPSCMKKRQILFGEFLAEEVLEPVSHRHLTFSIPRRLRVYFRNHRGLLAGLSRCAWEATLEALRQELGLPEGMGAAVNLLHTWGDLLDWHPHVHGLFAWGLFDADDSYRGAPQIPDTVIHDLFRMKVFRLLREEGLIEADLVADMLAWPHSGFHVWVGPLVSCLDSAAIEHMGQYSARGPVSLERLGLAPGGGDAPGQMRYEAPDDTAGDGRRWPGWGLGQEDLGRVIITSGKYLSKHKGHTRVLDPISFIAELTQHIPDRHQKTSIAYGRYSNAHRGKRKKRAAAAAMAAGAAGGSVPAIVQVQESEDERPATTSKANWARLIKKVYETDPLLCPSCGGTMRIISIIDEDAVIYRILRHLGLLGQDPPERHVRGPPTGTEGR